MAAMKRVVVPILFFGVCAAVRAVQIYGTDGLNHLSAPADDPGWAHVGQVNGASCVFLGSYDSGYWALSARHVVGGVDGLSVSIAGASYATVAGSGVRLTNADTTPVDLMLFRLQGDPTLAALGRLSVAATSLGLGDTVRYVGYGYQRQSSLTYWSVTGTGAGTVWTVQPGPGGANALGYGWTGSTALSWGDNTVSALGQSVDIGNGPTAAFATTFSASNGSAMLAVGDSGGAAFRKVGGAWELAGINDAIGTYTNQPASTSVVGNLAYAADLSVYNAQIQAVIAIPEPTTWTACGGVVASALLLVRRRAKNKAPLR